ncbi:MAG: ATP-dependent endonuclease [Candidatus Gastranaerophilales bacterium]|nr:ATP-dependent endonuclease [Candidatus Gastranaerophilales bacterium]
MEKNTEYKIKPLTIQQIKISLDRLTRFKPTEDKYLRVFKDIISSNLLYPKYKKNELAELSYKELTFLAQEIFNFSFVALNLWCETDFSINKKLLKYEKSVFKFDKNAEKLINNKINYNAAITLLEDNELPLNLKWLKSLCQNDNQIENRANFGLKFPIEKIILVEGITEEILLPKFALLCGLDFNKAGIHLISAGGKNQVVKLFYQLADIVRLPIFVLLDNDAGENYEQIKPKLRKNDKVYIIERGEFEDILPLNLIKRNLNRHFKNFFSIKLNDLRKDAPMTSILDELFKSYGLEFKKAEFASLISESIQDDLSDEIRTIISKL